MNLQKLIEDHESSLAARERAEKEAREAKAANEAALLRLHAEKMQEALRHVVKPVLQEGIQQLSSMGYDGRVSETTSEEPKTGLSRIVVSVELVFSGKRTFFPGGGKGTYLLEYVGDVGRFTISAIEALHGGRCALEGGHNMPVSDVDSSIVERQLEGFVARALKVESGQ